MPLFPPAIPKYQYSKVRFFERVHGTEFLKFELEQMKKFAEAKKLDDVELDGYVAWSRPPYFVLLPTTTTPNAHIICKVEEGLPYPDLNQFSTINGKWRYDIIKKNPVKILKVTNINKTKPDFGKIKPDIAYHDFVGILFERWRNTRETTEQLIAQSLVSSPTSISERTGGFTLTLANFSKKNKLKFFMADLQRFIPAELTKNKPFSFKIPEFGITANLPKFGWDDHVSGLENISTDVNKKLDRIPNNMRECSITLLQKTMDPPNLDSRGVIKSDYPIVLEEYIEHTRRSHYVDPEVYKFILAVRMSSPVIPRKTYESSIQKSQEKLQEFGDIYKSFSQRKGDNQFWDMGYKGKPLSVHNLTMALGRANVSDSISIDDVEKTIKLYLENMENILDVHELWGYDKIPASASVTLEERKIYLFLEDHRAQSIQQIAYNLGLLEKDVEHTVQMLISKHLLFEPSSNRFSSV